MISRSLFVNNDVSRGVVLSEFAACLFSYFFMSGTSLRGALNVVLCKEVLGMTPTCKKPRLDCLSVCSEQQSNYYLQSLFFFLFLTVTDKQGVEKSPLAEGSSLSFIQRATRPQGEKRPFLGTSQRGFPWRAVPTL